MEVRVDLLFVALIVVFGGAIAALVLGCRRLEGDRRGR
jgi:hypothetical protein